MRKIYCFVLLFASLFVVFFIACRRDYSGGIQKPDVVAVRNWLHSYGGNYRNETIEVMLQNNQKMKAKLNWNAATKYSWQGKEYIDVPFEFENHGRYVQTGEDKAMAKFNLVVRKKGDGYEGAMRNVMYDITSESTNNTTSGKVVQMYQLLDGRPANIWLSNMASEIPKAARTENISATEFANRKLQAAKKTNLSGVKPGDRLMMAQPCTTTHIVTYSGNCNYIDGDQIVVTLCRHDTYVTTCEDVPTDPGTGGGGGGGGDGFPPDPSGNPPSNDPDPCLAAISGNVAAKDILSGSYNNGTPDQALKLSINSFHDMAKQPFNNTERSVSVQIRTTFPPNGGTVPVTEIGTTTISEGTATSVSTITQGSGRWVVIAGIHSHTANANTAPSVRDVYSLYDAHNTNSNYQYQFVFAADGSRYVMTIADPAALDSFMHSHPASQYVDANNSWNIATDLGTDFQKTYDYLLNNQGLSPSNAYEKAFAYSLSQNKTGIALSKADANGDFKGIFVKKDAVQGKKNYNKVTSTSDCNL